MAISLAAMADAPGSDAKAANRPARVRMRVRKGLDMISPQEPCSCRRAGWEERCGLHRNVAAAARHGKAGRLDSPIRGPVQECHMHYRAWAICAAAMSITTGLVRAHAAEPADAEPTFLTTQNADSEPLI